MENNTDYRYETSDESRNFHRQRRAFVILNKKLEFLDKGSEMSHFEYLNEKGIDKETFRKVIRGTYLNGNLSFYKDNFIYDDALIKEALSYIEEIAKTLNINEFNIYFGHKPEENFAFDYYYGKYINGSIKK